MREVDSRPDTVRIAAVVVTYNRKALLAECLTALQHQSRPLDEVVVVDNASTDGTDHLVKERFAGITYVKLSENIGGAGGFREGMKLAFEQGHDWIWIMDDDAVALPNALEELCKVLALDLPMVGVLGCMTGAAYEGSADSYTEAFVKVPAVIFVGFLVSRRAIEKVGLPRSDFFIYFDDREYCARLIGGGFALYRVTHSRIDHRISGSVRTRTLNLVFRRVSIPLTDYWRSYYYWRNHILFEKSQPSYAGLRSILRPSLLRGVAVQIGIGVLMIDIRRIRFVLKVVLDGFTNRTGKRVVPGAK